MSTPKTTFDSARGLSAHSSQEGFTALMMAAQNGHRRVVWHLLEAHADVSLRHTAPGMRLLDCSSDVYQQQNDGATALFFAAQRGHSDIVYLLMSAGATAEESTLGISPKQIAQANGHTIVAAIFDTLPPPLVQGPSPVSQTTSLLEHSKPDSCNQTQHSPWPASPIALGAIVSALFVVLFGVSMQSSTAEALNDVNDPPPPERKNKLWHGRNNALNATSHADSSPEISS
ncbi:hypothetical protein ACHHYP_10878 [Achlya hypogyna]|uniref:Uncharacterized protein n=1 Tax=Achlya hypogyna TaxID=1202772 RepID=A0A1V9YKC6_ACHHY|nr:hypothetical protein ACHHYP_10878 [Achlya hypogyna]